VRGLALGFALASCGAPPAPTPAPAAWQPGPADPRDLMVLVMVDRFADGRPDPAGTVDRSDPQAFHGGDLAGLTARLDHLQSLGFRTVWLTPITAMRTEKLHGHGAFHGYWVTEPTRIEPRFGELEDLRTLREELRRRDMRLVLDVVWNHLAWDAPKVTERPDWFHHFGDITDWHDPAQLVTHDVHGLPDLAVEDPEVRAFLEQATDWLVEAGQPDGLRIDAVRHLPADFVAGMAARLRQRHGPHFGLLAEDFEGAAVKLAARQATAGVDRVFDFPLRYALVDAVCKGAGPGRLAGTLGLDRLYADPGSMVSFLDNHDLPRVASECGGDLDRVGLALAALYTLRGTPCLSWGTEQGLAGAGEPHNRASMRWQDPMPLAGLMAELAARRLPADSSALVGLGPDWLAWEGGGQRVALNLGDQPLAVTRFATGATRAWEVRAGALRDLRASQWQAPLAAGALRAWEAPPGPPLAPAVVQVQVRADLPADADLRLVGGGPELGHWDPAAAPRLAPGSAKGSWTATLGPLPAVAWEWKLVLREAGGERWEPCPNRVAWDRGTWKASWGDCEPAP
jgi:hypothetical protein